MNSKSLFIAAQQGNQQAIDRLVRDNMGLVYQQANRFHSAKVSLEDREQEGVIGLLKAIRGFDVTAGTEFSTYAVPKVKHEIRRAIQNADTIRVPVYQQDGRADLSDAACDAQNVGSLDIPVGEDGSGDLLDLVGDVDAGFADVDFRAMLDGLSDREADVLTLSFVAGESLAEIGKRFGFSRERARQVQAAALGKLKDSLAAA